ncbi:MAG: hypothetical protein ACREPA_03805 [Candidatus Dormibacteraceae bacterium]
MKVLLLVILVLVGGGAYLYSAATTQDHPLPPVQLSGAATLSAEGKLGRLVAAEALARAARRPIPVSISLTDAEISSLVNQRLADSGERQADHLVLHATGAGTLEGTADGHVNGWTFPIYVEGIVSIEAGQPRLQVQTAQIGRLPMPGPLQQRVQSLIRRNLNLGRTLSGLSDLHARLAGNSLTLSGVARP